MSLHWFLLLYIIFRFHKCKLDFINLSPRSRKNHLLLHDRYCVIMCDLLCRPTHLVCVRDEPGVLSGEWSRTELPSAFQKRVNLVTWGRFLRLKQESASCRIIADNMRRFLWTFLEELLIKWNESFLTCWELPNNEEAAELYITSRSAAADAQFCSFLYLQFIFLKQTWDWS